MESARRSAGLAKESRLGAVVEPGAAPLTFTGQRWARSAAASARARSDISRTSRSYSHTPTMRPSLAAAQSVGLANEGATITLVCLAGGELGNRAGTSAVRGDRGDSTCQTT